MINIYKQLAHNYVRIHEVKLYIWSDKNFPITVMRFQALYHISDLKLRSAVCKLLG